MGRFRCKPEKAGEEGYLHTLRHRCASAMIASGAHRGIGVAEPMLYLSDRSFQPPVWCLLSEERRVDPKVETAPGSRESQFRQDQSASGATIRLNGAIA